jgi:hypothetical protein
MSPPLVEIVYGMPNNNFRHRFKFEKEEMNTLSKGVTVDTSAKTIKTNSNSITWLGGG